MIYSTIFIKQKTVKILFNKNYIMKNSRQLSPIWYMLYILYKFLNIYCTSKTGQKLYINDRLILLNYPTILVFKLF